VNLLDRLQARLRRRDHLPVALRWLMTLLEYALVLLRDLLEGEISLRAMSLVYTSLLSLVPLLALAFSLLKALGVHNGLDPLLRNFLAPLGPDAGQLADHIIGFVNNVKVGVLGSVGVGLLLWTAISLIYKVESAFNFLWEIPRSRGLPQRFSDYIAVLIVGPTLVFLALGVTASLRSSRVVASLHNVQLLGPVVLAAINVIPYLLMVAVFSFLYRFIPNTRVRLLPAAVGGVVAGFCGRPPASPSRPLSPVRPTTTPSTPASRSWCCCCCGSTSAG
jgi:tRNA-processing RNAse BN (EC 3.1.-.-)